MNVILNNQKIAELYYRAENGDISFDLGELCADEGIIVKHPYDDANDEVMVADARMLGGVIPVRNERLSRIMSEDFVLDSGRIAWSDWGFFMTFIIQGDMRNGEKMYYPLCCLYKIKNGKLTAMELYQDRQQAEPWYLGYAEIEIKEPLSEMIEKYYAKKLDGMSITQVNYPIPDNISTADYDMLVKYNEDIAKLFIKFLNGDTSVNTTNFVGGKVSVGNVDNDIMVSVRGKTFIDIIIKRELRLKQTMSDYSTDEMGYLAWGDWGFIMERTIKGTLSNGSKVYLPVCEAYSIKKGRITSVEFYYDRQQAEPLLNIESLLFS